MSVAEPDASPKLVRELSTIDASMIVVGSMIGSGIFITSAESSRLVGAPGWLLVAWGLAGLLTVLGALCCSELSAMMPRAGGQYVFLREAYGPLVGFLFGWSMFLVVQTGTIAAVSVAFAKFLGVFTDQVGAEQYLVAPIRLGSSFAVSLSRQQLVSVAVVLSLTAINLRGLRTGKLIQNTLTATKTAALVGLIVVGILVGFSRGSAAFTSSWWNSAANGWTIDGKGVPTGLAGVAGLGFAMLLGKAMIGPLFSQTAWNNVTFTGGEVRDPGKSLPRALILGCSAVVLLYLLANVAYIVSLPLEQIQKAPENRVGTVAMEHALGSFGRYAMAGAILISTFGCVNGLVLAGARVYYAMARDGLFFAKIGTTNRNHVPAVALVSQGVWAALLTLPRTVTTKPGGVVEYGNVYNQLLDFIIPADMCFYALMVGAVFVMRRKAPAADRPYRTPGFPIPPLIYLVLAVLVVVDLLVLDPKVSGAGFGIVLTGLPAYLLWRRSAR